MIAVSAGFALLLAPKGAEPSSLPPNFQESTVFSGLVSPTMIRFASDGRVFVAEKSGLIKVFASLTASTPTIFADLRPQVFDFWDRGLLAMELDPGFPDRPYVYVLYTLDKNPADPTATVPTWGDACPDPPGATGSGCPALGRVSRLDASAAWPVQGTEQVLIEGFGQQFPSHSVGSLGFGPDGALYISAGEGASFLVVDYGQLGGSSGVGPGQSVPVNPLGDPPAGVGGLQTPPGAEGGALRSQSLRRAAGEPVLLNGAVLRVDPNTGAALPDNPLYGLPDENARRIVAFGLRNPFRFTMRPGTREVWVGDVGWDTWDEINRFDLAEGSPPNFGWPCYEGPGPQPGYRAAGLAICQGLYTDGSARRPFFSYHETAPIVPGESCPTGTSSVSGLAFYPSGSYPALYQGALFFTDWARHCIWAMLPDAGGTPDPTRIVTFAAGLDGGAVQIERGPGGDLFYVDYDGGRIQRITYFGGNQPPVARITATPTSGLTPLLVQFDGSTSSDPDGDPVTYAWDLDGDGVFNDSTLPNPAYTFTTSGEHRVALMVRDPAGATSTATISIFADNRPPHATITLPTAATTWKVGDTIFFAGGATDPEQGSLPASALQWTLRLHHCPSSCHIHTVQSWTGFAAGSFSAPDHDYPSWLELRLSATDAGGLVDTTSVELQPQTVVLSFRTDPPGLTVGMNGAALTTPFSQTVIVGSANSVSAPSPQDVAGSPYGFWSWSDAGAATHVVTAPATATTLVATYRPLADLSLAQVASPDPALQQGRVTLTATVTNNGPAAATGIQLVESLPAGVTLVPPSDAACAPAGASLSCALADLPAGASHTLTLTLRPSRAGPLSLAARVSSDQADPNPADNAVSGGPNVQPLGDVSGDGHPDLLWQNLGTGAVGALLMSGTVATGVAALVPGRGPQTTWRLGGMGDFDGDGKPDLVWRDQSSGAAEIWFMDQMTRKSVSSLAAVPGPVWSIAGVGDFNGDGWPDILWRHQLYGLNLVVYMQGSTAIGVASLPTVAVTWQLTGVADLNGDGKPDLLWRRIADGSNQAWFLDGVTVTGATALPSAADLNWRVAAVVDLNGDGKPDLVWRNQATGADYAIFLDGTTAVGGALLPSLADSNWAVIGPR
jgi:uncharacterized repeat protein (TIGR01451 family)